MLVFSPRFLPSVCILQYMDHKWCMKWMSCSKFLFDTFGHAIIFLIFAFKLFIRCSSVKCHVNKWILKYKKIWSDLISNIKKYFNVVQKFWLNVKKCYSKDFRDKFGHWKNGKPSWFSIIEGLCHFDFTKQ